MLFTIKRPKSERFFQLRFQGFRPKGQNIIDRYLKIGISFLRFLLFYFKRKIILLFKLCLGVFTFLNKTSLSIKAYILRKLIWSRGKLGRPVVTFVVMTTAFLLFMLGEVFNSSKLVNSQEISPDYLTNTTDIIPQRNTAMTTLPEDRQRTEATTYIVQAGDTLSDIGSKFKISIDALRYVNNLTDTSYLKVGQSLIIPPVSGLIHKVESGDTLSSIAAKYGVASQAIADFNYLLDTRLAVGTELIIPGAKVPEPIIFAPVITAQYFAPVIDSSAKRGWCSWPTTTRIITQYFSWYHNGLDIATSWASSMPPLFACAGGVVIRAGWDPWGLGLHVRISHGNGYETVYGHMSKLYVSYGEKVSRGEVIGIMGSTGRSTGPHVHFTVKYNGVPQNPLNYIN